MALAHFVVVKVVGRGDFHAPRSKLGVHIVIRNDRNFASDQGQRDGLAHQGGIALVLWMDRHGLIAQHGFWAGGRHHQLAAAIA